MFLLVCSMVPIDYGVLQWLHTSLLWAIPLLQYLPFHDRDALNPALSLLCYLSSQLFDSFLSVYSVYDWKSLCWWEIARLVKRQGSKFPVKDNLWSYQTGRIEWVLDLSLWLWRRPIGYTAELWHTPLLPLRVHLTVDEAKERVPPL